MPPKPKTVGGGSATPVAQDWSQMLQGILQNGYAANVPNNPQQDFWNSQQGQSMQRLMPGIANKFQGMQQGMNPSGGMGTPPVNPTGAQNQQQGFADVINQALNQNPSNSFYSNPNNPRPDGMINNLANMQFDPMQFQTPNAGPSDAYNNAISGMFGVGGDLNSVFSQAMNAATGGNMLPAPSVYRAGQFSSDGLMGDRGNVLNAITQAAQTQRGDALAAANERFTAMGGLGGNSTSSAFERAITNARGDEGLATALAQQDLGYRNLDLNAYNSYNNAQLGADNINAYMYGNQLDAMGKNLSTGLNAALGAAGQQGNILGNIAGSEFNQQQLASQNQMGTNQLNLNSALGFNQLNSANAQNAASLANQLFGTQANMDMNTQQLSQQQQMQMMQMLFGAMGQQAGLGTPQAQTVMQQNPLLGAVQGLSGLLPGAGQFMQGIQSLGGGMPNINTTPQMQQTQFTPMQMQPLWTPQMPQVPLLNI